MSLLPRPATAEVDAPARRTDAAHLRALALAAVQLSPAALLAVMGYQRRWVAEDAFIDFRVVANLLAGHGPVFNLGERVEAYTNPLWVALLALWGSLGGQLEIGSVVMGLALTVTGVLAAQAAAARLTGQRGNRIIFPLGALVVAVIPVAWDFATSGLETGLLFGWLGVSFWLLAGLAAGRETPNRHRWLAVAALLGLGPLIRPDLGLFSASFLVAEVGLLALAHGVRASVRPALLLLVAFGAVPAAYEGFRAGYFAALVPNTALAKSAGAAYWSQGLTYARDFVDPYRLWVPLAILLGFWAATTLRSAARRDWAIALVRVAPVVAAVLDALYVMRVGGDFMHGRLLLPSLFGLMLPVASVGVPRPRTVDRHTLAPAVAVLVLVIWASSCALWFRVPYAGALKPGRIADERGFYVNHSGHAHPIAASAYADIGLGQFGQGLRALAESDARILELQSEEDQPLDQAVRAPLSPTVPATFGAVGIRTNIGISGYVAGPRVWLVDRLGLADPIAARLTLSQRGRPGHEKWLPDAWYLGRFADPAADVPEPEAVAAARQALSCGELRTLMQAVEAPMTVNRFLQNVRLAWTLHALQIPDDPLAARAQFCGTR